MRLGLRAPNFPISRTVLGHLGSDFVGTWETGKYIPLQIMNSAEPCGLGSFGKLGNWEVQSSSQFPKKCWPIWAGVFWEIGKLGSMYQ